MSPIEQLDGITDLDLPVDSPNNDHPRHGVRVAPYCLDQRKQVAKIVNDTNIDDFEIVVSPSEHNVTIHCSTGFYSMVTVPAFSAISINSSVSAGDFNVVCYDIIAKNDGSNAGVNSVF